MGPFGGVSSFESKRLRGYSIFVLGLDRFDRMRWGPGGAVALRQRSIEPECGSGAMAAPIDERRSARQRVERRECGAAREPSRRSSHGRDGRHADAERERRTIRVYADE